MIYQCPPISLFFFFFNDTATTEIYTLSLHDALPISKGTARGATTRSKTGKVGMEMLSPVSQRCDESQLESIKAREQTPCRSLDESATTWRLACSSSHEVASPQNNRHKTAVPSL